VGTASVPAPAGAADPQREGGWREGLTGRCGRVPARRRHPAYGRGGDRRMDWPAAAAEGRGSVGGGGEGSVEACRGGVEPRAVRVHPRFFCKNFQKRKG